MPRPNPRRRIDQLAAEAQRAIEAQRENVLLTDADLADRSVVRSPDIDAAQALWHDANDGTDVARLLDGPPREDEP